MGIMASIILTLLLCRPLFAAEIRSLTSGQTGNKAYVQYDLVGKSGEEMADVAVYLEVYGERYPASKLSLTGDFGKGVKVGIGKRFLWDFMKDIPAGFDGDVTWDVEASGGAVSVPATFDKGGDKKVHVTPQSQDSCVTSECHGNMNTQKYVHVPVASGDCISCHKPTGKHRFVPITEFGKLCSECHKRFDTQKFVHVPTEQGKCHYCHDPHQSPNKNLLRTDGAELCFMCHDRSMMKRKFVHGPVAAGSCSSCHTVHQANFTKFLRAANDSQLCLACHVVTDSHKTLGACGSCHDIHSSNLSKLLLDNATRP